MERLLLKIYMFVSKYQLKSFRQPFFCLYKYVKHNPSPHLSHQHFIDENPEAPPVHGSGVRRIRQDLRGQKLRGPTERACAVPIAHSCRKKQTKQTVSVSRRKVRTYHSASSIPTFFAKPKVSNLYVTIHV